MIKKKNYRDLQDYLHLKLQDKQEALAYLNAALNDEDKRVFLIALKDVLDARGGDISDLSSTTKLNRVNLYRMLSQKGNPRWSSIRLVMEALGLSFNVKVSSR
jgi:probable addiction module antidote protein